MKFPFSIVQVQEIRDNLARLLGKVQLTDGTYDAEVDKLGYLVTIEIEHHKVHDGVAFIASDHQTGINTASPQTWRVTAPNTINRIHLSIGFVTDTDGHLEIYENPTLTANGTAVTAYNNDRNSANVTTAAFAYDATYSSAGTKILHTHVGAGGNQKIGGVARSESEWILKQNEDYIIEFTPSANGATASIEFSFYEVGL